MLAYSVMWNPGADPPFSTVKGGVKSAYLADETPVDYTRDFTTPVSRRAIDYTMVILVCDPHRVIDRFEAYRALGVDAKIYPLPPYHAPTLYSLLGLLALLEESSRKGRILVEGCGGEAVIAIAHMLFKGLSLQEAIEKASSSGLNLLSPLQLRILALVDHALRHGVDLWSLALRLKGCAFTGGDAHKSSILELALEHTLQLAGILPLRPSSLVQAIEEPSSNVRLNDVERLVLEACRSLDYTMSGAVKSIAIAPGEDSLEVYLGCELLYRDDQCWPEAEASRPYYDRLAKTLGLKRASFYMDHPETVSCMVYSVLHPEVCLGLEEF